MKEKLMAKVAHDAIKETVEEVLGGKEAVKQFVHTNLKTLLEQLVNNFMAAERKLFQKNHDDVGNGFYSRILQSSLGKLALDVPRTRHYNFRPSLLPQPYKRTEESYDNLLESLIQNGYSPNALRTTLATLNLNYSPKEIEIITGALKKRYYEFIQKELPEDVFVLYIDAYRAEMKDKEQGKVKTITIYTIIGITIDWKKTLLGFYLEKGVEKKQGWLRIFNDLIARGLRKISLIVSDDFSGLKDAIRELFPHTDHQLCLTHFKRNITRNMSKQDSRVFKERFSNLTLKPSYETALPVFEQLILDYQERYKSFMTHLWLKRTHYLSFLKYPEPIRKYIYTTNVSENFHRRLEYMRSRMGGFFQSEEILGINIILQLDRLKAGKWEMPHTYFAAHQYELLQIHRLKFKSNNPKANEEFKKAEKEMATALKIYTKKESDSTRSKI
jgi:transposase-like protein